MIVMIVSIVFAVMFLVLAVIFLMGKGDMLKYRQRRRTQDYRYQATKNCHGRPDGGNRRLLHHSASPRQ